MKAIAYGALCALTAASALESATPSVRNVCALLAAAAFILFIGNVGRQPAR